MTLLRISRVNLTRVAWPKPVMSPEDDLAAAGSMDNEHALDTICEQGMTPLAEQEYLKLEEEMEQMLAELKACEAQQKALQAEHEQLTNDIENDKRVAAESLTHSDTFIKALEHELSNQKATELEARAEITRVSITITESLQRKQELERYRGQQQEVNKQLSTALNKAQDDLESQRCKWQVEKLCLLQTLAQTEQNFAELQTSLMVQKEQKLEELEACEAEQNALQGEHEQLRKEIENNKRVAAECLAHSEACIVARELELSNQKSTELEACAEITKVNSAITESLQRKQELERCRGQQQEINIQLSTALTKAEDDLESQRCQWQVEKSCLLQTLGDMTQAQEDRKREEEETRKATMDTVTQLEQQVQTIVSSKKKKRSWQKRSFK